VLCPHGRRTSRIKSACLNRSLIPAL
jgi:hypothetical protein